MSAAYRCADDNLHAVLEVVVNLSEGRNPAFIDRFAAAAGNDLLDLHVDPFHNRSVLTLVGEAAVRRVASVALSSLDLRRHRGVHPRLGVVDVVPFVPLAGSTLADAGAARDRYAAWSPVPCVRYGTDLGVTLPELRRSHGSLVAADPRAGMTCAGAREVLVAYNLWLAGSSVREARALAASVRSAAVRALGLAVGDGVQVSMNLVDPATVGPADVYDAVAGRTRIRRAELVGLVPRSVLDQTPEGRWEQLDLSPERTIELRLASRSGRD